MGRKIEGLLTGEGKKFAIVTARFNELITFKLEEGAIDCFRRHGVSEDNIDTVIIPGLTPQVIGM